jgi:hypothetical protein
MRRRGPAAASLVSEGERKQGSVKRHRTIIPTTALVALICAAAPPVALAGSLLSGYGGPGEGSQALIGATLVKGGKGGGGSSAGSSGGRPDLAAPAASSDSTSSSGTPGSRSSSPSSGSRSGSSSHGSSAGRARHADGKSGKAGENSQGTTQASFASYPRSERVAGGSTTLVFGLSGADFAYVLVALACLLLTGFATIGLARRSTQAGVGAKGISPSVRGRQ